ncbi:MAG: hypothetical protein ACR2GD_05115 [Pyrinomonadaceae bacterium]
MSDENGTGSSAIWAVAIIIIVAIIAGALYYSGFLGKAAQGTKENTTINVTAPAANH